MQVPGTHISAGINNEDIFEFRNGIPGFEQFTRYVVIPHDDSFSFLQSVEKDSLAFIIANPFQFFENYELEISANDLEELEIGNIEEVIVRSIITWGDELTSVTANLMAPIIFNAKNRRGKQVVLYPTSYNSKHPLIRNGQDPKGRGV